MRLPGYVDWRGNHHLCGDVNFDGFVNLEDIEAVREQAMQFTGEGDKWGTCPTCYDPNRDLNMDGSVAFPDIQLVESAFGGATPWYVVNKNPTLIDEGAGWAPRSALEIPNEWWGNVDAKTFFIYGTTGKPARGFEHMLLLKPPRKLMMAPGIINPTVVGMCAGGYRDWCPFDNVWTEAGIGEPYEHPNTLNPEPWDYDVPLLPAKNHEFWVESEIIHWTLGEIKSYLSYGFGGWIILEEPYEIEAKHPILGDRTYQSRIIEVMFQVRNEQSGETLSPGGDKWHRIMIRAGIGESAFFPETAFWMVHYILDKPEVGERMVHKIEPETFASLIEELQGPIEIRNVVAPLRAEVGESLRGFEAARTEFIDFTNAKIRIAYLNLEGGTDVNMNGELDDVSSFADVVHYGFWHYRRRTGSIWKPVLSPLTSISVS